MSAIPFEVLGSSGAKQWQVSEGQPYPQTLLTEYFAFGYDFDPSNWIPHEGIGLGDKSIYNPLNDLLNPLNVGPDELLQRQSLEYMEEQILRRNYEQLREKQLFLSRVPASIRDGVELLYDRGLLDSNLTQGDLDRQINSLIQQGQLGTYDAGHLRALISQRTTWQTLLNQSRQQTNTGNLEGLLQTLVQTLTSRGLPPGVARTESIRGLQSVLSRTSETEPSRLFEPVLAEVDRSLSRAESQVGTGARADQASTEAEIMEGDDLLLDPLHSTVGLGARRVHSSAVGGIASGALSGDTQGLNPFAPVSFRPRVVGTSSDSVYSTVAGTRISSIEEGSVGLTTAPLRINPPPLSPPVEPTDVRRTSRTPLSPGSTFVRPGSTFVRPESPVASPRPMARTPRTTIRDLTSALGTFPTETQEALSRELEAQAEERRVAGMTRQERRVDELRRQTEAVARQLTEAEIERQRLLQRQRDARGRRRD